MTGLGCMSTKGISEWSIPQGDFRLQSFNTMLNFLGRSLGEDPEYHVEKDPRTPQVYENPVHTMELLLSDGAPSGADLSIQSHGKYYAVNTTGPLARWNPRGLQNAVSLVPNDRQRGASRRSPQHHDCEVTGPQLHCQYSSLWPGIMQNSSSPLIEKGLT